MPSVDEVAGRHLLEITHRSLVERRAIVSPRQSAPRSYGRVLNGVLRARATASMPGKACTRETNSQVEAFGADGIVAACEEIQDAVVNTLSVEKPGVSICRRRRLDQEATSRRPGARSSKPTCSITRLQSGRALALPSHRHFARPSDFNASARSTPLVCSAGTSPNKNGRAKSDGGANRHHAPVEIGGERDRDTALLGPKKWPRRWRDQYATGDADCRRECEARIVSLALSVTS